jgi:hypothetical protein
MIRENVHPKWLDRRLMFVMKKLQKAYFFKRFGAGRLREFLDIIHLNVLPKKRLLFFDPKKVYVIISGSI